MNDTKNSNKTNTGTPGESAINAGTGADTQSQTAAAAFDRHSHTLSRLHKVYGICLLVLGLFLALGTQLVFHACGIHADGSYGRCHYAQLVIGCLGGLMAVGAIYIPLLKSREATIAISVITACEAGLTLLMPDTIIPLCMMADMPCRAMMKPFTMVMGITILLVSVIGLVVVVRRKEK